MIDIGHKDTVNTRRRMLKVVEKNIPRNLGVSDSKLCEREDCERREDQLAASLTLYKQIFSNKTIASYIDGCKPNHIATTDKQRFSYIPFLYLSASECLIIDFYIRNSFHTIHTSATQPQPISTRNPSPDTQIPIMPY